MIQIYLDCNRKIVMETIIKLLQKKRKLKETLEQINNDSRYRNISFVCAGSLRKGSRN